MGDLETTLNHIDRMYKAGRFEPYLKFIEFSSFKNFEERTRLTLNYPITALVGGNGTNKSSILKALESCCPDKIISNRWFSTHVDAISHDPVPQFWYAHNLIDGTDTQEAQVLISKYRRKGNPDYWEKSKPIVSIGMARIPEDPAFKTKWKVTTRWPQIEKEVLYFTFRETISAFDKFFYYGDSIERYSNSSLRKKNIRWYSRYLQKVISQNLNSYTFRNKEKVIANYKIDSDELLAISKILEVEYTEIQIVEHTFFHCNGITCKISKNNIEYSEAFAGSGEFAVIKIVHEILKAKDNSLILLDEPEVSLHPGAQERLMQFIATQTKKKLLQVVIATHSPTLIKHLPSQAIKTLSLNPSTNKVSIKDEGCKAEEAFFHLGHITNEKIRFIVEDRLAKQLVLHSVRTLSEAQKNLFEVEFYNGGAFDILNNFAVVYAFEGNTKIFIYLDGDQKNGDLPNPENLTEAEILNLETVFTRYCGGRLQIPRNSNMTNSEKKVINLKILNWLKNQVIFLPTDGYPEQMIWNKLSSEYKVEIESSTSNFKERFRLLTEKTMPSGMEITSETIYFIQLQNLATIQSDDNDLEEIYNTVLEKIST
ncbi:ATP-dependent endonuclease [Acinetobacter baumannii]|uniref:ATP-dependent endonuclease n=1 Tax=Acinetobacter baumannii TaxID=470 RepID=UPI0034CFCA2C